MKYETVSCMFEILSRIFVWSAIKIFACNFLKSNRIHLLTKSFHCRTIVYLAAKIGPHKFLCNMAVQTLILDASFHRADGHTSDYVVLQNLA